MHNELYIIRNNVICNFNVIILDIVYIQLNIIISSMYDFISALRHKDVESDIFETFLCRQKNTNGAISNVPSYSRTFYRGQFARVAHTRLKKSPRAPNRLEIHKIRVSSSSFLSSQASDAIYSFYFFQPLQIFIRLDFQEKIVQTSDAVCFHSGISSHAQEYLRCHCDFRESQPSTLGLKSIGFKYSRLKIKIDVRRLLLLQRLNGRNYLKINYSD